MTIWPGSMVGRGWGGDLTSPASGEVDARSAAGGGRYIHLTSAFCGDTPTPTLPRKREREHSRARTLHLHYCLAIDLAGTGLRQLVDEFYLARMLVRQ